MLKLLVVIERPDMARYFTVAGVEESEYKKYPVVYREKGQTSVSE